MRNSTLALASPIVRRTQLTVDDLRSLNLPIEIDGSLIRIEKSLTDWKLRQPVCLNLNKVLDAKEKGLVDYVIRSFISDRPALLPFVFDNQSLLKMARYLLRHCSSSHKSCLVYTVNVYKYAVWLGYTPDQIIADLKPVGNIPDPQRIQNHTGNLSDYLAQLQDDGLKPGSVENYIKAVKTFYRVNGAKIELSEPLSRRVIYKDRAPKPDELAKMLDLTNLRGRVIVSCLALGAFREETFTKLTYRHVKEDLEANITPIHLHIEAEITKGKYHDYDTFLGPEAAYYLKTYLEQRRKGTEKIPPEIITDDSPLIRDITHRKPKGISTKQLRKTVHDLYVKAGFIKPNHTGTLYNLRVHSIRKFFKTQMLALGVQPDYVDYFMGHTVDTYHDIQSLGIDRMRCIYAAAGLAIRTKTQVSKLDTIKEMIRALGENPEQMLSREALSMGNVTSVEGIENHQLSVLSLQLRDILRKATET
jgi:site-specific recombinase XerD